MPSIYGIKGSRKSVSAVVVLAALLNVSVNALTVHSQMQSQAHNLKIKTRAQRADLFDHLRSKLAQSAGSEEDAYADIAEKL